MMSYTRILAVACCLFFSTILFSQANSWNIVAAQGGTPLHTNISGTQTQVVLCTTAVRDGIIYAWRDTRAGNQDIWCQKFTPCGVVAPGWPAAGLSICNNGSIQQLPMIIPDATDGAIIVWEDNRNGSTDIYAQHVTGAGVPTWGSATTGLAICNATSTQQGPRLCTDGSGGAIIAWDDNRSGNWDVWSQRVNAAGTCLWNPANWGNPVVTFASTQDHVAICHDGSGGAYYAWEDARATSNSGDVYATRFDANGIAVTAWASPYITLTAQNTAQHSACIALFPNGNVAFAWCDPLGTGQSIQASIYSSTAVLQPGWNANGNLVGYAITSSGNPGTASSPRMVTNCAGGLIISYRSPYGSGDNDVLTREMNANGTQGAFEYTAFGTNWEGNHELAADGNGGAYNVFEDRNSPVYVKYRKFLTAPSPTVSSGANGRDIPNICAMQGVAYFAWEDSRPAVLGTTDIYCGATSSLGPPPILNSTLTQTYTATSCNIATQNVTTCSGTSITFTVPLPAGLFSTYTFLDGATTLQTGSSNTFTTSALTVGTHTITATSSTAAGCATAPSNQIIITVSAGPNLALSSQTNVTCFGGSNGSATVTASAGTAPYTYAWAPSGGNAATASGLTAGVYVCTVTDATGCTRTTTATITQPAAITSTPVTNPATCGNNNGSATVTPTGGTGPYTYLWTPSGGTGSVATGLTAGNYTCTVTDANSCTAQFAISISNSGAPSVSLTSSSNVSCFNGSNGSASVTATGGTSPYTYSWSPSGGTSASATGLTAGTYTCTVTDAAGCVQQQTVTITQPTVLTASIAGTNPLCNSGATGSATVTPSGGAGSYTYSWLPNGGTGATASGLAQNTYSCTITDANGCTTQQTVTLTAPAAFSVTTVQTNVSCNAGTNGTASVTVTGGTGTYTYAWTPSGGTAAVATNLAANNYTCTITDANGCTTTQAFNITQPTALSATSSQTNVLCNGDSTGSASVAASGGVPAYSYVWAPYGGTAATATLLASGGYTCTITDANGCQATQTVTLTQATAITSTINIADALCNGAASGSATAVPTGGSGTYTYSWTSGSTSATANNLAAGSYTVTVTDGNGCTHVNTAVISEPTAITSTFVTADATCNLSNGSATVTPTGGTGTYTYSWSSGGTAAIETGLAAGVYTCTITDQNACTRTQVVTINNAGAPTVTPNTHVDVTCNGDSNGSASVNVTGGTAPYTYSWSSGSTTASESNLSAGSYICTVTDQIGCIQSLSVTITEPAPITASTNVTAATCGNPNGSATVTPTGGNGTYSYSWNSGGTAATENNLAAGNYTCTITDIAGCTGTATVAIANSGSPSVTLGTQTDVSCFNGSNGSITVNVSGGTTPYTYLWSSTGTAATESNLVAGNYTCTVTDQNGCTQTFSTTVTQPTALTSSATTNPAMCTQNNGDATVTISGGTAPYIYSWSSGSTSATATGLAPGMYTCQVIDANGCSIMDTVNVQQNAGGPTVTLQSQTDPLCNGDSTGAATVNVTSGNGPYTYSWAPFGGTTATGTGLNANSFTCTVTDVNGCSSTQTVTLNDPAAITPAITSNIPVQCNGQTTGSAAVSATGGTGTLTYNWMPGNVSGASLSGVGASTYTCTITDANGCTAAQVVTITQPATAVSASASGTSGCGTNAADATATGSGGTSPYTYAWSSGGTAATESNLATGTYTCTVTDANGCSTTTTVSVTSNLNPTATVTSSQTIFLGGNATITAGGGTSYAWTPTTDLSCSNCQTTVADPAATTLYCVTATDGNGCTDSACTFIYVDSECGEIFVPNAFSPNNDNSNDELCVYGNQCIKEMEFVIYDRWGEKVYESKDPSACWDGTFRGKELNTGVYVYYLRGTTYTDQPINMEGNISLMR